MQVLLGPSLMIIFAWLQMLRKKLTEKHTPPKLYDDIDKFLKNSEARDKVGRFVQYGCRAIQGVLAHMDASSALQAYKPIIAEVQTTLAWARRTHRWGKAMPHVPKLGKAISDGDILQACQSSVLITFLVQDHIYWLLKVGILKFKNYTAVQWHRRNLRFIIMSHVLNFALCVRDIKRTQKKMEEASVSAKKGQEAIYDNQRQMFRYVLTFIQMLHVSQLKVMDDWYIGIFGMISSYIDASKQWPK